MFDKSYFQELKDKFTEQIGISEDIDHITTLKNEYTWKQGVIPWLFTQLATLDIEEKKSVWPMIHDLKNYVDKVIELKQKKLFVDQVNKKLENDLIDTNFDITLDRWYRNLIFSEIVRLYDIFTKKWFDRHLGSEVVSKTQNFTTVNIPPNHPATDIHDTIYLDRWSDTDAKWDTEKDLILRTHTSSMQNQLIKQYGPECMFVVPGKVYRYENMDATHDVAFWQIEWVVIWKNISIANFKHTIKDIIKDIFEKDIDIRLRPWYFPFTEPSFEIDIDCRNDEKLFELSKKRWWLEVLGAGMIHPNVLKMSDVDPNEYSGFAFGLWLSRLVAIKYGIKDIRLLTNGDLRFVRSFN